MHKEKPTAANMTTIPLIATDNRLFDRVAPVVKDSPGSDTHVVLVGSAADALDFLNTELPDLVFINFSDSVIDGFALLENILKDSWLLHSNIVAFCADHDTSERLEKIRSANIVVSLIDDDVEKYLPRIFHIIVNNQRILYQRALSADLIPTISGSYKLDNNLIEAHCYANLLCNYLYNANKIDVRGKMRINVALTEMLINAIEHGNCGITYDEKGAWLDAGNTMGGLIARKCLDDAIRARRVVFEYTITPSKTTFTIADEGEGFDWRGLRDPSKQENVQELHGRGIKLTRKYTRNLTYNDRGNEATFEIEHADDCANAVPALFENMVPNAVKCGDVIFREGEDGDFLYYIVKGHYDVVLNGAVVAVLTAEDIFMGEMSFLLNNRRSATVRATTAGVLIRISKADIVEAIKQKPQYALVLARLLAQRLKRSNMDQLDRG
jgi:anti-sigma regulatory factor (Ser/Thr protein kinase)